VVCQYAFLRPQFVSGLLAMLSYSAVFLNCDHPSIDLIQCEANGQSQSSGSKRRRGTAGRLGDAGSRVNSLARLYI
jgi:hypothetical protein